VEIRYNHFPRIAAALPREVGEIVQRAAFEVEAQAKIIVPVDTGTLKGSIQTEPEGATAQIVYTPMDYSVFVEYGTVKMGAQPFMTPAAETVRPGFIAALRNLERGLA
jgi:HK97 gp10 family phage protein